MASEELPILQALQQLTAEETAEAVCQTVKEGLQRFCRRYHDQRNFTSSSHQPAFKKLLLLATEVWLRPDWILPPITGPPPGDRSETTQSGGVAESHGSFVHAALMCLRLLLRDVEMQHVLLAQDHALPTLAGFLGQLVSLHFSPSGHIPPGPHPSGLHPSLVLSSATDILRELTNIFQKISNTADYRHVLLECEVHAHLVRLLWSHDLVALQCTLCALVNLCKTDSVCACVSELSVVMPLLHIVTTYDPVSRHLAADLLLLLSQQAPFKQQVQNCDSLPTCLSILRSEDLHLLHRMVGVVEGLAEAPYFLEEIRQLGGIPLLLNILKQQVLSEESTGHAQGKVVALRAVCCAALTRLLLDDHNAQLIVQGNGVYLVATSILPPTHKVPARLQENLQRHALRALRYLFSMERNRRVFKKLFPPDLFTVFIDIGHYNSRLSSYSKLVHTINNLTESQLSEMSSNIDDINQDHAPLFSLAGYVVLDLLGSGSFGCVYKVKKQGTDQLYALKEIRGNLPALGQTLGERSSSLKRLFNEVEITREHLRHPNIVLYHKCFQEGDHLYIVMELLEGAPLSDYFVSMEEKGSKFSEDRLWRIFLQLLLALRYLHKDRRVIHRDLSPANVMLNEDDKLTITDFGLAKLKQREFSVMKSVVGTMLYWCPELVESEPYTETADVWAAGCILYQMAMLRPPFQTSNLLALAKKIVEVEYEPIPSELYSPLVGEVVTSCLTADPTQRPDTVKLGGQLSSVLMSHMDVLSISKEALEKRLAKEKQRTVRHYHKALTSERRYHQLLSASSNTPDDTITPQNHTHTIETESISSPHVRRQLSRAFASAQSQQDQPCGPDQHTVNFSRAQSNLEEPSCSNDVFHEDKERAGPCGRPYHLVDWEQPASPQVLVRGRGKLNPATFLAQASSLSTHQRKQSSGDPPTSLHLHHIPRRTSAPARTPSWTSGPLGYHGNTTAPLSPLAAGRKSRTPSASSTVSISPKHLREVTDPILSLLTPLHKLLHLTQLPPSHTPSSRQALVLQYKQLLFARGSNPPELKAELHQLANGSVDAVRMFDSSDRVRDGGWAHLVQRALREMREGGVSLECEGSINYSTLLLMIEGLAIELGYYGNMETTHNPN